MPVPASSPLRVALDTARAQLRSGELHGAVGTLMAAEQHHPRTAVIPRTLGEIYASCGHGPAAIECMERALAITPDDPQLLGLLVTAHVVDQDLPAARQACQEALRRFPDSAHLHSALGLVEQTAGDKQAAAVALRRALELDEVGQCLAAYRLARLGEELDLDRLEYVVERLPRTAPEESWRALHFAIAETADRRGEHARAFRHLLAGNRHSELGVYKPELEVERASSIVNTFTERFFAERRGVGHRGQRPVFVVSLPRSGTSLLEQMLDSHPELEGRGEDRFFGRLLGRMECGLGENPANYAKFHHLSPETWAELGRRYMAGRTLDTVDKAMSLDEVLGPIVCSLPEARIIHLQRDRRDVALSNLMTNFGPFTCPHAASPINTVLHVERHEALMQHWKQVLPVPILDVHYRDLVQQPERELRRVFEFVGLEYDPDVLEFHRNQRPVFTASLQQVRQPLNRRGLDKWRKYEAELREVLPPDWFEDVDAPPQARRA